MVNIKKNQSQGQGSELMIRNRIMFCLHSNDCLHSHSSHFQGGNHQSEHLQSFAVAMVTDLRIKQCSHTDSASESPTPFSRSLPEPKSVPPSLHPTEQTLHGGQEALNFTDSWFCIVGVILSLNLLFCCVIAVLKAVDRKWGVYGGSIR